MKKYKKFIILLVLLLLVALFIFIFLNNKKEETVNIETYNNLLIESRKLTKQGDYKAAINIIEDALDVYKDDRGYIALYINYDWLEQKEEAHSALYKALYLFNNLDPMHWRELAILTAQLTDKDNGGFEDVSKIYNDGIILLTKARQSSVVNLYTAYATYLSGNGYYQKAIDILFTAQEIDKERFDIYQTEIDYLNSLIQ